MLTEEEFDTAIKEIINHHNKVSSVKLKLNKKFPFTLKNKIKIYDMLYNDEIDSSKSIVIWLHINEKKAHLINTDEKKSYDKILESFSNLLIKLSKNI